MYLSLKLMWVDYKLLFITLFTEQTANWASDQVTSVTEKNF